MAFVIFGDLFSFPEGEASTNRVYTYAKGLSKNDVNVYVICFENTYVENHEGKTEGIQYYNPFNQTERSNYFVIRRWQKFIKYFRTIALIRRINKKDKISIIMIYTMRFSTFIFAWYLSLIHNAKLIRECSEHPLLHYQRGSFRKVQGLIKLSIESFLCDSIFCISRFLVDFYSERGFPKTRLFLVPSTVDPDRFTLSSERPLPYSYIGYFGGLTFYRDNIDVLIRSFAAISERHPDMHLVVGGFCSENERKQIEKLILDLDLSLKVNLLKYMSRSEIVRYIVHSDILVMVRAKDLETQASFPSKLTEYLATSKPLVTVNVGEIPDYLTDGVTAFLIEPGNIDQLAEKLEYVINNYELALEIAKNGKQLADSTFNYNFQAKRIIKYIETL